MDPYSYLAHARADIAACPSACTTESAGAPRRCAGSPALRPYYFAGLLRLIAKIRRIERFGADDRQPLQNGRNPAGGPGAAHNRRPSGR
ncbi:hypothetical protein Bamb_4168 [Burkholderia ambifaria AMMD]|uniref:Uncharacterized protein n=1 Tax=Burkholderia ambifaria (strain ATCC BAA-244 / DSM 16087 / CCUG 44356 / LMG 19182 / AMMD) TaxID=339670 RepID=Q0B802_BURCM|nr:hypothetical protein Bamb_4168 [Burkholderia ambifaria AMMD]